jgi:hypothetical protein
MFLDHSAFDSKREAIDGSGLEFKLQLVFGIGNL